MSLWVPVCQMSVLTLRKGCGFSGTESQAVIKLLGFLHGPWILGLCVRLHPAPYPPTAPDCRPSGHLTILPWSTFAEHANYFGVDEKLGPVAVSIKREKLEDHKDHGPQYQYRIIFRTREVGPSTVCLLDK